MISIHAGNRANVKVREISKVFTLITEYDYDISMLRTLVILRRVTTFNI
jgi:hypothetical protein